MSTIEFSMVVIFWARNPISFKHMMPLKYLTTYHSNTSVQWRYVTELGMPNLLFSSFQHLKWNGHTVTFRDYTSK
jgi:hypothetical protein